MATRQIGTDRLSLFSDGVFAVLITILVIELKPPEEHRFRALLPLWPTGLSYAVGYLFIAIRSPVAAMVLICLCLVGYPRPDVPAKAD